MKDYFVYIMTIAAGPCSMSKLDDRGNHPREGNQRLATREEESAGEDIESQMGRSNRIIVWRCGKMSDAGKAERELAAAMFLRRAACHPECKRGISPKVVDYTSYLTQSMSS